MKKIVLLIVIFLFVACSKEKKTESIKSFNMILLLKVDYVTNKFEGGNEQIIYKEITNSDTIPITVNYEAPGDSGNISLYYQETNDLLFDGSIIWMGTGAIKYPLAFKPASTYPLLQAPIDKPDSSRFKNIFCQQPIDYSLIWNSISKLEIVLAYLQSNKKIEIFLYTPSVGVGNPNEWDWFVIMNK